MVLTSLSPNLDLGANIPLLLVNVCSGGNQTTGGFTKILDCLNPRAAWLLGASIRSSPCTGRLLRTSLRRMTVRRLNVKYDQDLRVPGSHQVSISLV